MAKKMFDILPPKVAHKLENTLKELEVSHKKKGAKHTGNRKAKAKRFPWIELFTGGAVIVIMLAVYRAT